MSESKHTPGPWSYAPAVPGAQRCFYIAGNQDANNREVDIGTVQGGYYSCEANARLIAAAPDLLEELREARDSILGWAAYASEYFKDKHDLDGDIARIDAVIAKATGEA